MPDIKIEINSQVSGMIGRLMVEEGEYVEAGQPILEMRPNPTPIELGDAERDCEQARVQVQMARERLGSLSPCQRMIYLPLPT